MHCILLATLIRNETTISDNRLIASIFASMMTNFYGNINNLYTFTSDFRLPAPVKSAV